MFSDSLTPVACIRRGWPHSTLARKIDARSILTNSDHPELPEKFARALARNQRAAKFFGAQPPGYRRRVVWWIISAKQEPTRMKRLEKLIALSARQKRLE